MASTKVWVGGTSLVAVALLGGTWFLAVAPTLSLASETQVQTAATEQQNADLRTKIAQLKVDFANLPALEQDLADLRVGIPTSLELADYLRELDGIAAASSVTLLDLAFQDSVTVPVAAAPAADVPDPSATTTSTAGVEGETAEVAPAAPAAIDGFVAVPVTLTALGTFPNGLGFLGALQTGTQRIFLPGAVSAVGQPAAPGSGGRPETAEGDIELKVTGYLYVLEDTTAVDPSPGPTGELPQLDDRNPVAPNA